MVISVYSVGRTYILVGGGPRRVAPSCEMVSARSRLQILLPLLRAAGRDGATRRDHRPKATARLQLL